MWLYILVICVLIYLVIKRIINVVDSMVCKEIKKDVNKVDNIEKNTKFEFRVIEIPGILTPDECKKLIELSKNKLKPSNIYTDENNGESVVIAKDKRKSFSCRLSGDRFVKMIDDRLKNLTYSNENMSENLEVIKYEAGGYASGHYDACSGSSEFCKKVNGEGGQRMLTVILYLNDDYDGGETFFPKINKIVRPEVGKVVIFYNINPDESIIEESFHEGLLVKRGEKWIVNKWIRVNNLR
jgi:prolyl 4-hydroxylase